MTTARRLAGYGQEPRTGYINLDKIKPGQRRRMTKKARHTLRHPVKAPERAPETLGIITDEVQPATISADSIIKGIDLRRRINIKERA